jgi:NitT/TauT family transport system ATP-binding protein
MAFLTLERAALSYGEDVVVDGVDLTLAQGEFCCLIGRSGCGKTSLPKIAAGLLPPGAGRVSFDGEEVREPSGKIGFVFQSPTLLDWHTVLDNVLLPISLARRVTPADRDGARDVLSRVGLSDLADRHPRSLSGGQQSRVALSRALITAPRLLLLDEPFAALDAITREDLQDDLMRLCAERGTTVLFVTHDISEALYLADRVVVMRAGQLAAEVTVGLERPRHRGIRHDPRFNALARDLRGALEIRE